MRLPFLRRQPDEPPRFLIVGLGNPGAEYSGTRHNVGYRVIETLAARHRIDASKHEKRALVGFGRIREVPVVLARPITFMNLSGESVAPLLSLLQLTPTDLIVVSDDMDLPVGRLRVRPFGSAGGHNGLKSLIHCLRTDAFPRVRIGVGRSGGSQVDHVLGKFGRQELEPIAAAIETAADAVEYILTEGLEAAMRRVNPAPKPPPPQPAPTKPEDETPG